jgi:hypothetical protein
MKKEKNKKPEDHIIMAAYEAFAYISEETDVSRVEFRRAALHGMIDDLVNEFIKDIKEMKP